MEQIFTWRGHGHNTYSFVLWPIHRKKNITSGRHTQNINLNKFPILINQKQNIKSDKNQLIYAVVMVKASTDIQMELRI